MKKIILLMSCGLVLAGGLSAQRAEELVTGKPAAPETVVTVSELGTPVNNYAYRLLMGYFHERNGSNSHAQEMWFSFNTGNNWAGSLSGYAFMAGAVTWIWGDDMSRGLYGRALDPDVKAIATLGLLGSSVLLGASNTSTGMNLVLPGKPSAMRARFADVLDAEDPDVQENLARAGIKAMAEEFRNRRLVGAAINILTPLAITGLTAWYNQAHDLPWDRHLVTINSSMVMSLVGGLGLLSQPSEPELLEGRYQEAVRNGGVK